MRVIRWLIAVQVIFVLLLGWVVWKFARLDAELGKVEEIVLLQNDVLQKILDMPDAADPDDSDAPLCMDMDGNEAPCAAPVPKKGLQD